MGQLSSLPESWFARSETQKDGYTSMVHGGTMMVSDDEVEVPPRANTTLQSTNERTSTLNSEDEEWMVHTGDEDNFRVGTMLGTLNVFFDLARDTSMDVRNDPRFVTKSVMDKRISAFKSLTIVSSLMFGTALSQVTGTHKTFNFQHTDPLVGNIGVWELLAFVLACIVALMCMLPMYVLVHQIFYCTRLQTAGPTGFEQSSQFYLTRAMVLWRHLAVSCLFNGLVVFIVLIGIQYFLLFYNDANDKVTKPEAFYVTNLDNGTSVEDLGITFPKHHKLNMVVSTAIAYATGISMIATTCFLWRVRVDHLECFKLHYAQACLRSAPLEHQFAEMGHRAGPIPSVN